MKCRFVYYGNIFREILTRLAFADEAAGDVDAGTSAGADVGVGGAFVDVLALVCHPNLAVPLRADAHERADDVLAVVAAVVGFGLALVQVHAVAAVGGKGVPVRADAAEGSGDVVTPLNS